MLSTPAPENVETPLLFLFVCTGSRHRIGEIGILEVFRFCSRKTCLFSIFCSPRFTFSLGAFGRKAYCGVVSFLIFLSQRIVQYCFVDRIFFLQHASTVKTEIWNFSRTQKGLSHEVVRHCETKNIR